MSLVQLLLFQHRTLVPPGQAICRAVQFIHKNETVFHSQQAYTEQSTSKRIPRSLNILQLRSYSYKINNEGLKRTNPPTFLPLLKKLSCSQSNDNA